MRRLLITGMILLTAATALEAAPRGRRQRRRSSHQQYTRVATPSRVTPSKLAKASTLESEAKDYTVKNVVDSTTKEQEKQPLVVAHVAKKDTKTETDSGRGTSAVKHENPALAELNQLRAKRGLRTFIEDKALSALARKKAQIQASRGVMHHPGGTLGGARFEGVGVGKQFRTCYQYSSNGKHAGAATVVGDNGRRYHCLLIR